MDIGFEEGDKILGGVVRETDSEIDAPEGADDSESILESIDWSVGGFVEVFDALV